MNVESSTMMCTVADVSKQAQAIRAATDKSIMARDMYTEQVVSQLTESLKTAQEQGHEALLGYKNLGSLPDNKLAAVNGLAKLDAEIAEAMRVVRKDQTLMFRKATEASFRSGVYRGIEEFAAAQMPFYKDLTSQGIDKLTTSVFTLIDTDALDFMANYNLVLVGDIHRELESGIKKTILSGIATGKGVEGIVADMGKVIEDKESFRHAGSKIFSNAQYRMEMIARTEVLRAHNQGRIKFHQQVGVQKLEWMAMEDERTCPVCGPLDGKVFDTDKFPSQPRHPMCRCTSVVSWPLVICGGELGAIAAADTGSSCILPPQAIEQQAKQKVEAEKKLKSAFDSGEIADLSTLTVKQLQTLAKQNGIAIARTKADFIKLLDASEPGIHHGDLLGSALTAKVKQYNIAALRSKDDLTKLLSEKQAVIKQAKALAEAAKNASHPGGLQSLTMVQLKQMAKEQGISLNLTKPEVIQILDALEPGVDHSGLSGKALLTPKQKYLIPPLKNKEQLVQALEKSAGNQMAEQAKQQALESAKQAVLKKAEQAVKEASEKVVVPTSVSGYQEFLASVKAVQEEMAKASCLPDSVLSEHAKSVELKKMLFHGKVAAMNSGELKEIAKTSKVKHWQWASKDDLITIFTQPDASEVESAKSGIEAKHAKWAEKHLSGKSKPAQAAKPGKASPAVPKAQTILPTAEPKITESPVFTKTGYAFDSVDAAWSEKRAAAPFKYDGTANVGGAHEKEFWLDEYGNRWLFKPIGKSDDSFIAHGEEAAYKIGRLIDPEAVEVRIITLNGRVGSIQQWKNDLAAKYDFSGMGVADISADDIAQIQREHVIDWLISNHDGHAKQFLRAKDGKVYGIDKGQLFKFLGSDKLSIDYHPNHVCGESEPFYNTVFRAAKSGEIKFDPSVTMRYIREVEKIADEDYLAILKPYADGRFGRDELKKKAFYDAALSRKHNLRKDFEAYYADVLGYPGFRFGPASEKAAVRIGKAEEQIIEEAKTLGWQGKCLPIDEGDVEDQNALIFTEKTDKGERTVIRLKLRQEAECKILPNLKSAEIPSADVKIGDMLPEDSFSGDILAAVKTANHHANDGNYNRNTLGRAMQHRDNLETLSKSEDPDVRQMAKNYLDWLDKIETAVCDRKGIPEQFAAYSKQYKSPAKKATDTGYTVSKSKVLLTKRTVKQGELSVANEGVDMTSIFRTSIKPGEQYEIDFHDGTKASYRPWSSQNLFANSGEFEMVIPERPDAKIVDMALDRMERLGIKANIASAEDCELMYLQKAAYVSLKDSTPDYKKMVAVLDKRNATKTERIQALRTYWAKELRVKDITELPGYDPVGSYQMGFKDKSIQGGYRQQYRFDISEEDVAKQMRGYSLYHKVTNGRSISSFVDTVLTNNGAMISTVEKIRAGVPPGGMSPVSDMGSGGASYVFTRIRQTPTRWDSRTPGLYFKNKLLRRMDAVSYNHDAFGKVSDGYVSRNRGYTPGKWKEFAENSANETIFKHSITLLDNIELIIVNDEDEKARLLRMFKKHGVSVLPDGRPVGEMVIVS